jgi:hypothetical protein
MDMAQIIQILYIVLLVVGIGIGVKLFQILANIASISKRVESLTDISGWLKFFKFFKKFKN